MTQYTPPKNLINLNRYLGLVEPSSPKPIRRLNLKDRQIMLLALEGWSTEEVCDQVHVSPARVRRVLNSPQYAKVFEDFLQHKDREFQSLYNLSIAAVRDALRSDDIEVRLKAADKYFKVHAKAESGRGATTAEDVITRIMEIKLTEQISASTNPAQLNVQNMDTKVLTNEKV